MTSLEDALTALVLYRLSGPAMVRFSGRIADLVGNRPMKWSRYTEEQVAFALMRSSTGHSVRASGLRWFTLALLAPVPWASRVWALPFLTAPAPSVRYARARWARHKRLTD